MQKRVVEVKKALETVMDPELNISLVDLGLIYDVEDNKGDIVILMTLTTVGCPLFPIIQKTMTDAVRKVDGVQDVHIKLTFDPPWSTDKMTEKGKALLGI